MKSIDTEKIKAAYPAPPESFHTAVSGALDSLEDKKPLRFTGRKTAIRIAAACAAVAVIGTFTVAAAATNFFGLIATRNGSYGMNITIENSAASNAEMPHMHLKFGYLPSAYQNGLSLGSGFDYRNGEEYFMAMIRETDSFEFLNVIDSTETEYDGHKTLFMTFKQAENSDTLYYVVLKYFEQYNCLVQLNGSDPEELKKIAEKIDLEPAPQEESAPVEMEKEGRYCYNGAIVDYSRDGFEFMDAFFENKVKRVGIGESMEMTVADYEENAVAITAKITSVREQNDISRLEKKWFIDIGDGTTFDRYFNPDGTLKKEEIHTFFTDHDEDHLGIMKEETFTKHFYIADMEITAEEDIDDLHRSLEVDAFMYDGLTYYSSGTEKGEHAIIVYNTKEAEKLSLKKGETTTVQIGFLADNDVADMTYLSISAVDASCANLQHYALKVR